MYEGEEQVMISLAYGAIANVDQNAKSSIDVR